MPEAEDVILHAAERATTAARSLWPRHHPLGEAPGASLTEASRHLTFLLQACFGRDWPLTPSDPSPPPTWLAKRLGSPPPWELLPAAEAFTDGVQIFLPRRLHLFEEKARDQDLLRLIALMLGARLARGTVETCPSQPLARNLFWAADGVMVEAFLTAELPRLAEHIAAAFVAGLESVPGGRLRGWGACPRPRAGGLSTPRDRPPRRLLPDAPAERIAASTGHSDLRLV